MRTLLASPSLFALLQRTSTPIVKLPLNLGRFIGSLNMSKYNGRNFDGIESYEYSSPKPAWALRDFQQIEARITAARELRSRALGDLIAACASSCGRALHRVTGSIADAFATAFGRHSHS